MNSDQDGADKRTATDAQLSANRANAKKSTGPRTEAGKARSARNAVIHGIFASSAAPITRGPYREDPGEISAFIAEIVAELDPLGRLEQSQACKIAKMALQEWRLDNFETVLMSGAGRYSASDIDAAGGDETALSLARDLAIETAEWADSRIIWRAAKDAGDETPWERPEPVTDEPACTPELIAKYTKKTLKVPAIKSRWDAAMTPATETDWVHVLNLMLDHRFKTEDEVRAWRARMQRELGVKLQAVEGRVDEIAASRTLQVMSKSADRRRRGSRDLERALELYARLQERRQRAGGDEGCED